MSVYVIIYEMETMDLKEKKNGSSPSIWGEEEREK